MQLFAVPRLFMLPTYLHSGQISSRVTNPLASMGHRWAMHTRRSAPHCSWRGGRVHMSVGFRRLHQRRQCSLFEQRAQIEAKVPKSRKPRPDVPCNWRHLPRAVSRPTRLHHELEGLARWSGADYQTICPITLPVQGMTSRRERTVGHPKCP